MVDTYHSLVWGSGWFFCNNCLLPFIELELKNAGINCSSASSSIDRQYSRCADQVAFAMSIMLQNGVPLCIGSCFTVKPLREITPSQSCNVRQ